MTGFTQRDEEAERLVCNIDTRGGMEMDWRTVGPETEVDSYFEMTTTLTQMQDAQMQDACTHAHTHMYSCNWVLVLTFYEKS